MKITGKDIVWTSILGWSILIVPTIILGIVITIKVAQSPHTWAIIGVSAVLLSIAGLIGVSAGRLILKRSSNKFDESIRHLKETINKSGS